MALRGRLGVHLADVLYKAWLLSSRISLRTKFDADELQAYIIDMVSGMKAYEVEAITHVLDNVIDVRVDQWTQLIRAQYAAYLVRLRYRLGAAEAYLEKNRRVLLRDLRRLDEAGKILVAGEGWWAHKRAARAYRKASALHAKAQRKFALAEAERDYYYARIETASQIQAATIAERHALGAELKQLGRLTLAKRLRDASATDMFLSPETIERILSGSDRRPTNSS